MCPSNRRPPFCRRRSDQCDNDRDCPLTQKCCQLWCSNRCVDVAIDPVQKPGICPTSIDPAVVRCRPPITDECGNDDDCSGRLKCCSNPCGRICDLAQPKPGMCPSIRPPPFCRRRSDQCDNDRDCPLTQKCCQLGCSNRCVDVAIDPVQKPGTCPTPPDLALVSCLLPIINQCRNDGNCRLDLKCCPNPCGRRCDLDRPKPGFCSRITKPTEICLVVDNCKNDRDCPLSQKCCQQACGTRCENALVIAPPSKPGVCPVSVGPPVESCPSPPLTNQCNIDDDCSGDQKCCSSTCGRVCDLVKPKPGFCPNLPRSAFFVKCVPFSRCDNDGDCPSRQKCCERGCGRQCVNANTNSPIRKPGVCPTPPDLAATSCVLPITNECSNDRGCRDDLKCCPDPCGRRCDLVRPKPGVCPRFVPARRPCNKFDECENDRDCPLTQKCCRQGCGYRCQSVAKPVCPTLPCAGLIKCQYGQELDWNNCPTCQCRLCPKGVQLVNCLVHPCKFATCPSRPNARCVSNYCGGCKADFYENGNLVTC
ncbi:keratin-associated protein 10-7 [Patella vulgata]|uniref:keratin-associated protein 10-7 n=1 Tax=Patella vulgata TaxID=6465 RepID=UPI0024A8EA54|nr:keratin-associated protein 10-7 [Patella vulgata]